MLTARLLPWPIFAVLLAAACLLAARLYRRDREVAGGAAGRLLLGLRVSLLCLLILLLSDPAWVSREMVREPGEVVIFLDASRSFSLADPGRPAWQKEREKDALGAAGPELGGAPGSIEAASRRELAAGALAAGLGADLASRFRLSWIGLSGEAAPFPPPPLDAGRERLLAHLPAAGGAETDLGDALVREVLRRPREGLAGAVLITDGNHNAGGDPRAAARLLGMAGIPLITIGIGSIEKPPDLIFEGIDATEKVFEGDDVEAQAAVSAWGAVPREITLSVRDGDAVVKEVAASLPADGGTARIPISFPAGRPGRKKFTVSFPEAPRETSARNNSADLWVDVLGGKIRVLLLDGAPRWEERYLRASWSRDPGVELHSFVVTPPPDRRLPADFPRGRDALFAHDAIVLGDVEPSVFAREEIGFLRDFVLSRGGTLIVVSGERAMPYRWRETPLHEMLPVHLLEPAPPAGLGAAVARPGLPLALTAAGLTSGITRLVPGRERNAELWEVLPRPAWFSPIAGVKAGAEVLVAAGREAAPRLPGGAALPARPSSRPGEADPGSRARDDALEKFLRERGAVLVTRVFGAGKVLYSGIDATWRWRFRVGDELHRKFWGQVLRWAISGRLEAADEHVRLGTDSLLHAPGTAVSVNALIEASPGKPLEEGAVDAVITRTLDGAEARLRLEPVPKSGGRYRGTTDLAEIGLGPLQSTDPVEHRVRLEVPAIPGYAEAGSRAAASFVVVPAPDLEARATSLDAALLEEISSAAGGRFLPLSRFREAAGFLPSKDRTVERTTETSFWEYPLAAAALLIGLLAAEWILRKRKDLV